MIKLVRIEPFTTKRPVRVITLAEAIDEFGRSELLEYLQGHCHFSAFFLEIDGEPVYPVTRESLE